VSAAKHTPGPWFSPDRVHGTRYVEARIGGGMLQEVAACGPTEDPTQQAANARLISAAPELLDALKAFVHDIVPNSNDDPLWVNARAAILKATGEQA
jgi:hypothetical protein